MWPQGKIQNCGDCLYQCGVQKGTGKSVFFVSSQHITENKSAVSLIDWLMIAYIALFSALFSRLTALACGSTWVTSFVVLFFILWNIHWSGVLTALAWLVPHETAAVSAQVLCTPCTMSLHAMPHTYGVCVFSCNLPPALLAEWLGYFTWQHGGGTDTEIRVSTESWPWRHSDCCFVWPVQFVYALVVQLCIWLITVIVWAVSANNFATFQMSHWL